jgi:hypothetical protein
MKAAMVVNSGQVVRDSIGFESVTYGFPVGNMPWADGSTTQPFELTLGAIYI